MKASTGLWILAVAACSAASSIATWKIAAARSAAPEERPAKEAAPREPAAAPRVEGNAAQDKTQNGEKNAKLACKDAEMDVLEFSSYHGSRFDNAGSYVEAVLSESPDMSAAPSYVSLEAVGPGRKTRSIPATVSQSYSFANDKSGKYRRFPSIEVRGDIPYRTKMKLTLRKGMPCAEAKGAGGKRAALREDKTYFFERPDEEPRIRLAGRGRYLPPAGDRLLEVECVNISNFIVGVARIPSENIVHMLSLEESRYKSIYGSGRRGRWWWGDGEGAELYARDIAGKSAYRTFKPADRPNEKQTMRIPLHDNAPSNGVFCVTIRKDGNKEEAYNELTRIVCATDIGLTVRRSGNELLVWAVSLTGGKPVAGAKASVYSPANILLGEGTTDANGLARIKADASKGELFAVIAAAGGDCSFIAFSQYDATEERFPGRWAREDYLDGNGIDAYLWTDRGVYRHGEKIFVHGIVRDRDGKAPREQPLELVLKDPMGREFARKRLSSGADGIVSHEGFAVPDGRPGGKWTLSLCTPGENGVERGSRTVAIEEFVPPHIRVKVRAAQNANTTNFAFTAAAEHMHGGPANGLACEGAVVFSEAPFSPAGWNGWRFGDSGRTLNATFRRLDRGALDANGKFVFKAPLPKEAGTPGAAVAVKTQATVFEDGGRPAFANDSATIHFHPAYIGVELPDTLRKDAKRVAVACVAPDGKRLAAKRKLKAKLERIDSIYTYESTGGGGASWKCDRVRSVAKDGIEIELDGKGEGFLDMPADAAGDYALRIEDAGDGEKAAPFAGEFYLAAGDDAFVRAPLSTPEKISLKTDKPFYRAGERPKLSIRAPFAGVALVTAMREGTLYCKAFDLKTPTGEVELDPVDGAWAPNIDVSVQVVQGTVAAGTKRMAAKAHGETTVCIRRKENEIDVKASAKYGNGTVDVSIDAPGADAVAIAVVDAAIDLYCGGKGPDPVAHFAIPRTSDRPVYDMFGRLLPALERLQGNGAKTGGGDDSALMDRASPVASRRFKPLALWKAKVPVKDGKAAARFELPEFAGELRVSAVAYSAKACGAANIAVKAVPKLVFRPDAPRFAAPGDSFEVSMPLENTTGEAGEVAYSLSLSNAVFAAKGAGDGGTVRLDARGRTSVRFAVKAPDAPGEVAIAFKAEGFGETHCDTLFVPVRPAAAWRARSGTAAVEPGGKFAIPASSPSARTSCHVSGSRIEELRGALEWLAGYPHGCLEQTVSRVLPLVAAGGILNAVGSIEAGNRKEYVAAGVKRVESMIGESDFSMWPDTREPPWNREYSLYAAHFLAEAKAAGIEIDSYGAKRVAKFLRSWASDREDSVAAYACHTLALAKTPERDTMFKLYDRRDSLDTLSLARLARAFALTGDRKRAVALLDKAIEPQNVKEAAFLLLAALDAAPDDPRIPGFVDFLEKKRGKERFCWGTTSENAHALLAIGEYWRRNPPKPGKPDVREENGFLVNKGAGTAFVSWSSMDLPAPGEALRDESNGLEIRRAFYDAEGKPYDLSKAKCGDLAIVRIAISADRDRELSDLVVEDLFSAAMEPVKSPVRVEAMYPWTAKQGDRSWVLRTDVRDDRLILFSKKFNLAKGDEVVFFHPMRVVSAGEYVLPQVSVEAMYAPALRARACGGRVVSGH